MRQTLLAVAIFGLTSNISATSARADAPPRGWEPIPPVAVPGAVAPQSGEAPAYTELFQVNAATSGASVTNGPHENWLSIDYRATSGADTLYWSNNFGLAGTATLIGSFSLWTVSDQNCPDSSTNFVQYSHTEYAVKIVSTYTDGLGNLWTFENQYWHLGSYSTGTKANGSSFGTQATHPISGCKYYYAPGQSYNGKLASTAPHIHHYAVNATTYSSSPVYLQWTLNIQ